MPSWVQDPDTGELIPKDEWVERKRQKEPGASATILADIEPFTSPIDGRVISSRSGLREHNKQYGVTNIRDYGDEYFERRAKERSKNLTGSTFKAKKERIEDICRTMNEGQ